VLSRCVPIWLGAHRTLHLWESTLFSLPFASLSLPPAGVPKARQRPAVTEITADGF
jgi:hypothetical protein